MPGGAVLWFLQVADDTRVQIVETHGHQGIEHRPEGWQAGGIHQGQPVGTADREDVFTMLRRHTAFNDVSRTATSHPDLALLLLHFKAAGGLGSDDECIVAEAAIGQAELQPQCEVSRVTTRAPTDLGQSPAQMQRAFKRSFERVLHEAKPIDEIALSRPVGAHQIGQWAERNVTRRNALVVLHRDAADESRRIHQHPPGACEDTPLRWRLSQVAPIAAGGTTRSVLAHPRIAARAAGS